MPLRHAPRQSRNCGRSRPGAMSPACAPKRSLERSTTGDQTMAAKTSPQVHMGTITGGVAREILANNPIILLPMGSHEDQGPHAPMGDYLLAEKIAELAACRA